MGCLKKGRCRVCTTKGSYLKVGVSPVLLLMFRQISKFKHYVKHFTRSRSVKDLERRPLFIRFKFCRYLGLASSPNRV